MFRRSFVKTLGLVGSGILGGALSLTSRAQVNPDYDFVFTRLIYESGNWDVDERMPANVLNSLIEYTTLRVNLTEQVIALADPAMLSAPFC